MELEITVIAAGREAEERWAAEVRALVRGDGIQVRGRHEAAGALGQVVFVDGQWIGAGAELERLDRAGRAIFLIVGESAGIPRALLEGKVDDVIVHPFRPLEILSRVRHYRQLLAWDDVKRMNESFQQLVARLRDDVALAERMQKSKLPTRFPDLKGVKAQSRYLAGMRSGGDHFDLAESRDGMELSMVLTDSSSYGLSSNVLSALMRVAMKLSVDEARSAIETVRRIHDELVATLGQKDRLSMFYGVLHRKEFRLKYLNLGASSAYYSPAGERFRLLPSQGPAITQSGGLPEAVEGELRLQPDDRFVLLSDGFAEAAGGSEKASELLDRHRKEDAIDTLNELALAVKRKLTEPDDMPEQDCTALVLDVDSRVIRLANYSKE